MNERFSAEQGYESSGDCRESDRIRQDIDATLCEMDDTVGEIQERLQPRALLHRAKSAVVSPAGVIGIGIAWMLIDRLSGRGRYDEYEAGQRGWRGQAWAYRRNAPMPARGMTYARGAVSSMAQQAREKASDLSSRAGEAIHSARDAASSAVHSAKESAADLGHTVREQVTDATRFARRQAVHAGESVQRGARYAREQATDIYEENPLAVGAAALAAGLVGGLLLPSTRREDELMGRSRDELLDTAKGVGRGVLEAGKGVVQTAAHSAREEAQRSEGQPVAQRAASAIGRGLQAAAEEVQARAGAGQGAGMRQGTGMNAGPMAAGMVPGPACDEPRGTNPG